jgi:4'-phosphopantetheinyl transferase
MIAGPAAWTTPAQFPVLNSGELHAWRASLDMSIEQLRAHSCLLSSDERERADRFRFQRDRNRFIAARGVLRSILAGYLSLSPHTIRFSYGAYNKPSLEEEQNHCNLRFNLSHSESWVVFAFALDHEVGVDLELIRDQFATEEIAGVFFSPEELATFQNVPPHIKPDAFFNCWTRREAFIKAKGAGMSFALDQFSVTFLPCDPPRLANTAYNPNDALRWSLHTFSPAFRYVAAIAADCTLTELSFWDWTSGEPNARQRK